MRKSSNIRELLRLQPDYIGFIFFEKSKRNAAEILNTDLLKSFPSTTQKVGVFVNADIDFVTKKIEDFGLDMVQLHGDESPLFCNEIKSIGIKVIKVFSVGESFDFEQLKDYEDSVDFFLFDTKGKERGGNGVAFDWKLLDAYEGQTPYFLSGGIDLENIEFIGKLKTQPFAIDVNSKFEIEPGLKDIEKLKTLKSMI